MNLSHPNPGQPGFVNATRAFAGAAIALSMAAVLLLADLRSGQAAGEFPFDQELLLDAAPMQRVKRMPVLTVAANGMARIDLWCRTVPARVSLSVDAIKIETAPLPEALPQYMSAGQCSELRVQADSAMLDALTQMTEWQRQGDRVLLTGPTSPKPMRFRLSSH